MESSKSYMLGLVAALSNKYETLFLHKLIFPLCETRKTILCLFGICSAYFFEPMNKQFFVSFQ